MRLGPSASRTYAHPSYRRQESHRQKVGGKNGRRDGKCEARDSCPKAKAVTAAVVTLKAVIEQ
jgi:hypothetical protein